MSYKIVVDSCCELPARLKNDKRFECVPIGLEVGSYRVLDDEHFSRNEFLQRVLEYSKCPKSHCPSPVRFKEAYRTSADHVYCITLSSKLSGSYNSAILARDLYMEEYGDKQIHVVDSLSASGGETQLALKLMELEESGAPFEEIVDQIERYRDSIRTYFVPGNLDILRKNGRLTGIKSVVASTLNIKPIMDADCGMIRQRSHANGMNMALKKMAGLAAEEVKNPFTRRLIVTHCNALQRAERVRDYMLEKTDFKESIILETGGISSMYVSNGGVIVTV